MILKPILSAFSEVVDENRRWKPDWYSWLQAVLAALDPPPTTVAKLPAASGALGWHRTVTDSTVAFSNPSVGNVVVGGGANVVPVYSNGTDWRIG